MTLLDASPPDLTVWLAWIVAVWASVKLARDHRAGGDTA